MKKVQVTADVEVPRPINYIRYGERGQFQLDIADVPDHDLRAIAKAWGEMLVEHAAKRRGCRQEDVEEPGL